MNNKSMVLILFGLWTLVCWRYYVCEIKGICSFSTESATDKITLDPPVAETSPSPAPVENAIKTAENPAPVAHSSADYEEKVEILELDDHIEIHFPYNSTDKENDSAIDEFLQKLATTLRSNGHKVIITGHTDSVGDSGGNEKFALRRAKNIRDILKSKGVNGDQIICQSFGERKPIATNDTPAGRYKNRRVEIQIKN